MLCVTLLLAIPEYLKVFKLVKLPRSAVNSTPLGRLTRKELLFLTKAQTNSALIIYHMSYIYVGYRYVRIVVMACRYQTYDYFKFERKRERTPLIQQAKFLSTTQIARCHKPHLQQKMPINLIPGTCTSVHVLSAEKKTLILVFDTNNSINHQIVP